MRIIRKHNMTQKVGKNWVETKLPTLMQQYGDNVVSEPRYAWQDDTMEFSGHHQVGNIKGELRVTNTDFILDVDLPFAARLIEGNIRSGIGRWFDKNLPK